MSYDESVGRLDDAQMRGFDADSVRADRAEPEPLTDDWQKMLDDSTATAKRIREAAAADPEVERLLQHELAERDREWWAE